MLAILTTHPIQYQVPLWQALARDGQVPFEVWYLTRHNVEVSHDREFGKEFTWDIDLLSGYPHRFLATSSGATPNLFWKCRLREPLAERLRTSGAKALWIQGWQVAAYWQAVWAAKRAGVKVWLRGESNDLAPVPLWKREVKRLFLGQLFRRVDHFLYIGTANKRLYQHYGVTEDRLHSAPYAVDNERFRQQAEKLKNQKADIRKRWGIPEDAFCVLFCGKFIPKKRPMDLVNALAILNTQHSTLNCHALFVGSGELGDQLRNACHVVFDAELSDPQPSTLNPQPVARPCATFAGFLNQTEISKAYVAADCLVLPSDYGETWGLVVNEAMASGLPCVVSDACGCAEDMARSSTVRVFALGDVSTLAGCIRELSDAGKNSPIGISTISEFVVDRTVATARQLFGTMK